MGFGEGARDERLHAYLAGVAVDRDREAESVEDATAKLGIGYSERFGEVGERVKDLAGVVELDRGVCAVSVAKRGKRGLQFVAFGLERLDAVADEGGVDAGFDRAQLEFDSLVDVSESALKSIALVAAFASEFCCECGALLQESCDSPLAEHMLLEEAVDDGKEGALADVLPLAVAQRFGGLVTVGDAVRAGVVGDALAFLPVHAEQVVAGGAVDDSAQLVEAALRASPPCAFASAALVQFRCGALEPVVGDDRFVAVLRLDPLFLGPADNRSFCEFRLAEVEPVPVEAARVDGVLKDRSDGRLRPLAGSVAPAIDVSGWWWTTRAVEVVGDLFEAPSGEVAVEDLSDHLRLVRVWNES